VYRLVERTSSPEDFVAISWWISSGEVAMTPTPSTTAYAGTNPAARSAGSSR
jgi:hypothetical protein